MKRIPNKFHQGALATVISLACVSRKTNNLQGVFRRISLKDENSIVKQNTKGAVVYVGSSLTVHNPLFFVKKL